MALFDRLRSLLPPWRKPAPKPPESKAVVPRAPEGDVKDHARATVQKIRTAWLAGRFHLLPWLDRWTEETEEIRARYREMLREPTLQAALHGQVSAVASQDCQVHPENADDPREAQAAKAALHALKKVHGGSQWLPMGSGPRHIATSILYGAVIDGWSLCEVTLRREPEKRGPAAGKIIWETFKSKDTQSVQLVTDRYWGITGVKALRYNPGVVFEGPDLHSFVVFSRLSLFEHPIGTSAFRAAYRAFVIKDTVHRLRALHLDRFATPGVKATYLTMDQKAALEEAIEEFRATHYISVPTGVLVEAIDLSGRGTADYDKALDSLDREMLTAVCGAYLHMMTGNVGDARGDSQVQKETTELFQWALSAALGDAVTVQMLKPWYAFNYHDMEPGTATWGAVSEQALMARAQLDKVLQDIGLELSRKEAYAYFGRQRPASPDDVLGGSKNGGGGDGAPGAPPSGGPGGNGKGQPPDDEGGGDGGWAGFGEPSDWLELAPDLASFAEEDWTRTPGPRSQRRWVHTSGRVVYSDTNPGAPRGGSRGQRGSQAGGAAPAPAPAGGPDARAVLHLLRNDPASVTADHLQQLAGNLHHLTVAELRQARQQLAASFGGATRKEGMVAALRSHVQGMTAMAGEARQQQLTPQGRQQGRQPGDVWQGPSGRWFTVRQDGRVVPSRAPGGVQQQRAARPTPPDDPDTIHVAELLVGLPDDRAQGVDPSGVAPIPPAPPLPPSPPPPPPPPAPPPSRSADDIMANLSAGRYQGMGAAARLEADLARLPLAQQYDVRARAGLAYDPARAAITDPAEYARSLAGAIVAQQGQPPPPAAHRTAPRVAPAAGPPATPPRIPPIEGRAEDAPQLPQGATIPISASHQASIRSVFGRDVDPALLAAASNALDGAQVTVGSYGAGTVTVESTVPGVIHASRTFTRHSNGEIEVHNNLQRIDASQAGIGVAVFLNQIRALRAAGVDYVTTSAAGDFNAANSGGFNGYITWPKFGYDGDLTNEQFQRLPQHFQRALGRKRNVQALLAIPGGAEAWELHGSWIELRFDLADDSPNIKLLNRYVEQRRSRPDTGGHRRQQQGTPQERTARRRAELEAKIAQAAGTPAAPPAPQPATPAPRRGSAAPPPAPAPQPTPQPSAAASPLAREAQARIDRQSVLSAVDRQAGSGGMASLRDLAQHLGWDIPRLHAAVNALRQSGELTGQALEGRGGTDPEVRRHAIPEPGGTNVSHVGRRQQAQAAPPASSSGPAPLPGLPAHTRRNVQRLWDASLPAQQRLEAAADLDVHALDPLSLSGTGHQHGLHNEYFRTIAGAHQDFEHTLQSSGGNDPSRIESAVRDYTARATRATERIRNQLIPTLRQLAAAGHRERSYTGDVVEYGQMADAYERMLPEVESVTQQAIAAARARAAPPSTPQPPPQPPPQPRRGSWWPFGGRT